MSVILIILHVVILALLFGILIALHEIRDSLLVLTAQPIPVVNPYINRFKVPPGAEDFSKELKPHG